ncbi:MAG: hypothetical protein KDD63_09755, partial [Bacteroidetes bacterium]|nr:hypothetical protein [Bacteroidota bacterium]
YEAYTCFFICFNTELDFNNQIQYSWKSHTQPVDYNLQKKLIKTGKLKPEEAWLQLQNIEDGNPVISHAGSVYWNEFRKRYIMVFHQREGSSSNLGEVWYAEGDTPVGPWVYARKFVTHDRYSFYNVGQHPLFDQENGRIIYFEGTYTHMFSNSPSPTPRYDYNQIMYRLDLNDSRLSLPVPVYQVSFDKRQYDYILRETVDSLNLWQNIEQIPFFAIPPDRKFEGFTPVYLKSQKSSGGTPAFYGLPLKSFERDILGNWVCHVAGLDLQMNIEKTDNEFSVSFEDSTLKAYDWSLHDDSVYLKIKDLHENKEYQLSASLSEGGMTGTLREIKTNLNLEWKAKQISPISTLSQSPAVIPLYEYQNRKGDYYYSVNAELPDMKRAEKPICLVWKNPTTLLHLDFEAKPVRR